MTGITDPRMPSDAADSIARGVKGRIIFLILAGMIAVALVFGFTFYFALVANQSALARQVPELEIVAGRLKSLLIMNTLVFVVIIIASFFILSCIITARMFHSLALLHRDLAAIAGGKLPRGVEGREGGPFSALDDALRTMISTVREREHKEIEELTRCADALSGKVPRPETAQRLRELIAGKVAFIGSPKSAGEAGEKKEDPLFIQPL